MLDFLTKSITDGFTASSYLICTAVALLCGAVAAFAASYRNHTSRSFLVSLILLPVIVETVILLVNGNVGTGVAVMGAFSLVRFRSVAGKARDIVSIFLVMAVGLSLSAGYIGIAVLLTLVVSALLIAFAHVPLREERAMDLRITVPESLNYNGSFDEVFDRYLKNRKLISVKTTSMGSLYKLEYRVELKDMAQSRDFIDALRCRNGNLEIMLAQSAEGSEEL
ncbi:MAG: DUF4956 domain-containing protein [Clostridia bacterium]|nr:DUF4956 domain-containing protein [Clostridia bacterium]